MKKIIFSIITSFLSVVLLVILSEGLLRLKNFKPWTQFKPANEPIMHEPDPVLGWKSKKGNYLIPAYALSGKDIHVTFIDGGLRLTGTKEIGASSKLVIVGGSYTGGWAINDDETYAWKLQEKYPSMKVLNYGTGGYGTYQCLLVLEKELPRLKSPIIVLYGFIAHHRHRNVAPMYWLERLSRFSRRGTVYLPYVSYEEDKGVVRHAPEGYLALPGRELLATIAFIENRYMMIKARNRLKFKRLITELILLEMNKICEKYGAKFIVVMLSVPPKQKTQNEKFFRAKNIQFIDCVYPITPEMQVPGEGHPNGKMNSIWAECISKALGDQIEIQKKSNNSIQ